MIIKVKCNDSKDELILKESGDIIFLGLPGTSETKSMVNTLQSPFVEGEIYLDSHLNSLIFTINGLITSNVKENIDLLRKVFNPKKKGTLTYIEEESEKSIEFIANAVPMFEYSTYDYQKFSVEIYCPNPILKSKLIKKEVTSSTGLFKFPFSTTSDGVPMGTRLSSTIVKNNGDIDVDYILVISGPMTAPIEIKNNTTNEIINIKKSLTIHEKLIIDTKNKNIELLTETSKLRAFNYLNPDSRLFKLRVGGNEIEYNTANESEVGNLSISYEENYIW
ncbi:hypothetical protein J2127_000510 [Methanococcus voltae]|uniref:phage tail domain-containing protein n=1 Tax=Methanococcus voltae TaxID=2188 RepID=UPI001AE5AA46|nr:phage tail domain-containing protein [Methanococcus voltae]MBP2143355.1 hypothetical protein [Methanococcus voltae]